MIDHDIPLLGELLSHLILVAIFEPHSALRTEREGIDMPRGRIDSGQSRGCCPHRRSDESPCHKELHRSGDQRQGDSGTRTRQLRCLATEQQAKGDQALQAIPASDAILREFHRCSVACSSTPAQPTPIIKATMGRVRLKIMNDRPAEASTYRCRGRKAPPISRMPHCCPCHLPIRSRARAPTRARG